MTKVYTETGLWLEEIEDNIIKIGVSPKGQDDVGEVSFYDPMEEETLVAGQPFAAVEGSKAITEVPAPISGQIIERHEALLDQPEKLNETGDDNTWFVTVKTTDFKAENFLKEDLPIED